eukprot:CAMPEP_0198199970 /NCGR_PEP_ID=MMETSP1445-20131203/3062_1 /TAXON_ID=36898 /ORGANISM="Pyramimonas sp., Strain CCMP2087" /LENGTH=136 /DNA_ID=CAMNT_0043869887 /DNA_START=88 /DNA_END=495 /DNA_ORIENTATION=+
MPGKLTIHFLGGTHLRSVKMFGKMSPYIEAKFNHISYRTKTASVGSGSNPKWSEQVVFDVRGNVSECGPVFVEVFHANTLTNDDSIGEVSIAVTKVVHDGYDEGTFKLLHKHKPAGEIQLSLSWAGDTAGDTSRSA